MGQTILITGGAGFIGTHLANDLADQGQPVRILDDLSRPGVERNVEWLCQRHGARIEVMIGDVRERAVVREALRDTVMVYHLAAQGGTMNLLAALRACGSPPALVYASTGEDAGDQYVLDHARIFGLPTVVLRMSCVYGPGWIVDDLVDALRCCAERIDELHGRAFDLSGTPTSRVAERGL